MHKVLPPSPFRSIWTFLAYCLTFSTPVWKLLSFLGIVDLIANYADSSYADSIGSVLAHPLGMWIPVAAGFGLLMWINYRERSELSAPSMPSTTQPEPSDAAHSYPPPQKLPRDAASRTSLNGISFRLAEFSTHRDGTIRNITFENCTPHGPGILDPQGSTFIHTDFITEPDYGYPESLFYLAVRNREWYAGLIVVRNCVFRRCTFVEIGITRNSGYYSEIPRPYR